MDEMINLVFIKTTETSCDKNQTLRKKIKKWNPRGGFSI